MPHDILETLDNMAASGPSPRIGSVATHRCWHSIRAEGAFYAAAAFARTSGRQLSLVNRVDWHSTLRNRVDWFVGHSSPGKGLCIPDSDVGLKIPDQFEEARELRLSPTNVARQDPYRSRGAFAVLQAGPDHEAAGSGSIRPVGSMDALPVNPDHQLGSAPFQRILGRLLLKCV